MGLCVVGLELRVWGLVFGVVRCGFRDEGLGFRVGGLGLRV